MEGSTSEEGHNTQLWIESHLYFMIWSLLQLTLIHNLDVNSNKRRSIIAAPAPFEENRWPRWIHHLRVLHLPASCVEPSLISIKCFDGSYKPLNHFLPLWSKARKRSPYCAGSLDPWGSAAGSHRYYIMFIQEGVRPHVPASCRMTLIMATYRPPPLLSWGQIRVKLPQGQIQVKAITSPTLQLLNLLHRELERLFAALRPLTCPTRAEGGKNKTPR